MLSFASPLGWYWVIAPLGIAAFGGLLVLSGIGRLFSGEPASGGIRSIIGAPFAIVGLAAGLLAFNTQSFARLTFEAPVADVSVKSTDPANHLYDVTVTRRDGSNVVQICKLQGDEWLLSARVQKWKPWANVLGLDSTYNLDQVDNKYFDALAANGKPITACDLKGPPPAVNQYVPQSWLFWIVSQAYVEDRRFGSAVYMPLADGAAYRVVMTQSGLNAEPTNDAAKAANNARP
jgi:hypothetical protein